MRLGYIWDVFSAFRRFNPLYNQFIVVGKKKDFHLCFRVGTKNYAASIRTMEQPRPDLNIVKIPHKSSSRLASMMHDLVIEQLYTRLMKKS